MPDKFTKEASRKDIIIGEIECGGFAICELNDIIDACIKAVEKEE